MRIVLKDDNNNKHIVSFFKKNTFIKKNILHTANKKGEAEST